MSTARPRLVVTVDKPLPYTFDLGLLLASDPNSPSLPTPSAPDFESTLASTARDGAQSLINQFLLTCPIKRTKEAVLVSLPPSNTALPREKPIPPPKAETKWERFAKKKGIRPKTRENRRNLQYDKSSGEWRRKWGYKGLNKDGQDEPIIELNERTEANRKEGTTVRGDKRRDLRERIKKNAKRMRKNQAQAEKVS